MNKCLISRIKFLISGKFYLCMAVTGDLIFSMDWYLLSKDSVNDLILMGMTKTQCMIVESIFNCRNADEISRLMFISIKGVKYHKTIIYKLLANKLGHKTRMKHLIEYILPMISIQEAPYTPFTYRAMREEELHPIWSAHHKVTRTGPHTPRHIYARQRNWVFP